MRTRPWAAASALALLLATALHACSDGSNPGPCDPSEPFCLTEAADLEVEPVDRVVLVSNEAVPQGDSLEQVVRLVNTGDGTLQVSSVQLEYAPPAGASDGAKPAFTLVDPVFSFPAKVHTLGGADFPQGVELRVVYTRPPDSAPRSGRLVIKSNDPVEPTVTVDLRAEAGSPVLTTDKKTLDFKLVPMDEAHSFKLNLLNIGTMPLNVSGFALAGDIRFGAKGPGFDIGGGPNKIRSIDLPQAIPVPAGETRSVDVTFASDAPTPAEGVLRIFSNDPGSGATGYEVNLVANKSGPCVQISPRNVQFGGKLVGSVATIDVEVTSCGSEPLRITSFAIDPASSSDFGVNTSKLPVGTPEGGPTEAAPLVVPVNESVVIGVDFVPDEVNPKDADNKPIPDTGTLLIQSNAFESLAKIPLSGAGAESECPVPVIKVAEGDEVIPQTVLHLDGRQSYAAFGGIVQYQWSVAQPDGSQSTLVPSVTDPQPVFEANVVGVYTFKLDVWDESNTKSCESAEYQVLVQPDQAIHVELTWVTPGDADETDTGEGKGSDMDLHFAHPNATGPDLDGDGAPDPWFDEQWDAFWYNPNPNWGSFDPNANDDPSLDRDDTDGAGPENLNLGVPEEVGYRVAVHYWDDHGFGDALASVRIYSYATLIYERLDVPLNERDLWCVGEVLWPEAEVVDCGDVEGGIIVPDYVNPFFLQP